MPDITVQNQRVVEVTSAINGVGKLVLGVEGVNIGVVTDEFAAPPPTSMRLFIHDLPDGTPVAAQWQPVGGGLWWPFSPGTGGVYASFPVPAHGAPRVAFNFVALAVEHGLLIDDPRLVLRTKTA